MKGGGRGVDRMRRRDDGEDYSFVDGRLSCLSLTLTLTQGVGRLGLIPGFNLKRNQSEIYWSGLHFIGNSLILRVVVKRSDLSSLNMTQNYFEILIITLFS